MKNVILSCSVDVLSKWMNKLVSIDEEQIFFISVKDISKLPCELII